MPRSRESLGGRWKRRLPQSAAVLFFVLLPGASAGARQGAAPSEKVRERSILAGEPRLSRRVSLTVQRVYLGELLERLSTETEVRLEADDRLDPVSGYELTAVVHNRPVRELLEALPALFGHPPDRWFWTRERGSAPRYVLRHTLPAEDVRKRQDEWAHAFRVAQFQRNTFFYSLKPEQRALNARSDPYLQVLNDPRSRGEGFFSFIAELTEADLRSVARGGRLEIPIDRLSVAQRQFIRETYSRMNILGRPGIESPDDLKGIALFHDDGTIYLELGRSGGHGVLGGIWLTQALREKDLREWTGASVASGLDQAVPAPGQKVRAEELRIQNDTLDRLVERLGRLGRVNVLLDRSPYAGNVRHSAASYGLDGRLQDVLGRLKHHNLLWKHQQPFVLFCQQNWATQPRDALVPWSMLKSLRESAAANGGFLRPEDWFLLAGLRREQLEYLSREFPDASRVSASQVLLRLAKQMSHDEMTALARPEGAGWQDWSRATRSRLTVLFTPADAQRVRMIVRWQVEARPPRVHLYLGPSDAPLRPLEIELQPRRTEVEQERLGERRPPR